MSDENVRWVKVKFAAGDKYLTEPLEKKWKIVSKLGEGSFAVVKLIELVSNPKVKAAAKIVPKKIQNPDCEKNLIREILSYKLASASKHPNIVQMYGVYEDETNVYIVLELLRGGEVFGNNKTTYSEKDAARISYEMMLALQHCHKIGITHRDITPHNYLFKTKDPQSPIKLTDFGISYIDELNEQALRTACGTPKHIAPEVVRCQPYDARADVWSLGTIIFQMLLGYSPYDSAGENPLAVLRKVKYDSVKFIPEEWKDFSPEAQDFVSSLLTRDIKKRPTSEQALRHPWLAEAKERARKERAASGIVSPNGSDSKDVISPKSLDSKEQAAGVTSSSKADSKTSEFTLSGSIERTEGTRPKPSKTSEVNSEKQQSATNKSTKTATSKDSATARSFASSSSASPALTSIAAENTKAVDSVNLSLSNSRTIEASSSPPVSISLEENDSEIAKTPLSDVNPKNKSNTSTITAEIDSEQQREQGKKDIEAISPATLETEETKDNKDVPSKTKGSINSDRVKSIGAAKVSSQTVSSSVKEVSPLAPEVDGSIPGPNVDGFKSPMRCKSVISPRNKTPTLKQTSVDDREIATSKRRSGLVTFELPQQSPTIKALRKKVTTKSPFQQKDSEESTSRQPKSPLMRQAIAKDGDLVISSPTADSQLGENLRDSDENELHWSESVEITMTRSESIKVAKLDREELIKAKKKVVKKLKNRTEEALSPSAQDKYEEKYNVVEKGDRENLNESTEGTPKVRKVKKTKGKDSALSPKVQEEDTEDIGKEEIVDSAAESQTIELNQTIAQAEKTKAETVSKVQKSKKTKAKEVSVWTKDADLENRVKEGVEEVDNNDERVEENKDLTVDEDEKSLEISGQDEVATETEDHPDKTKVKMAKAATKDLKTKKKKPVKCLNENLTVTESILQNGSQPSGLKPPVPPIPPKSALQDILSNDLDALDAGSRLPFDVTTTPKSANSITPSGLKPPIGRRSTLQELPNSDSSDGTTSPKAAKAVVITKKVSGNSQDIKSPKTTKKKKVKTNIGFLDDEVQKSPDDKENFEGTIDGDEEMEEIDGETEVNEDQQGSEYTGMDEDEVSESDKDIMTVQEMEDIINQQMESHQKLSPTVRNHSSINLSPPSSSRLERLTLPNNPDNHRFEEFDSQSRLKSPKIRTFSLRPNGEGFISPRKNRPLFPDEQLPIDPIELKSPLEEDKKKKKKGLLGMFKKKENVSLK